ncbi:Acg family FMN-binding oxidoreductase [Streptomyces meridianus]|uniref:Nitroreductase n=1 Tax=Streptomyces meridianus TaxID=2938945 RepID=A0ABT0XBX1_9ACTN|nr:nitroreductase [Streptomyces meridianus]MCM2579765.1 nitroreductase [Streptomyces meridianus]
MSVRSIDRHQVAALVADAVMAPSMHNAQPWRFRYACGEAVFRLYADPQRRIPHSDPSDRGLHIGCGTALLNLRVALAHAGWAADTELLPEPGDPGLLATVRPVPDRPPDDGLAGLHPAIRSRHTSRHPFADLEVPRTVRDELGDAARQEGVRLEFVSAQHLETVLTLIRDAETYTFMDAGRDADTSRWTRFGDEAGAAEDGVPDYAFGPRRRGGRAPVRDLAGRRVLAGQDVADFEETPHLVLLSTSGDRPVDWLRTGQAVERVLLVATVHGLRASFATQALEWPDLRWALRDPVTGTGHVQLVLRFGYGAPGPATPRRAVHEVLDIQP